jgi:colanic acid/amylovoran biosynthesis glycosyltransferase
MGLFYLVPEFPSQTHAFFWREIQALRTLGVDVVPVSTRRPPPQACRHEFAQQAIGQTHYLFPPDWLSDLLYLLARPAGVLKSLAYVAGLTDSRWFQRMLVLPLILPAARLCSLERQLGADHLHVHSFANSAHVAALARLLGGCGYSLTLHGDLEVYGRDHASKTRHASFVTCVTRPLVQQVTEKLQLPSSFVHLLWMGVDTSRFQPVQHEERQPSEPLRMITVARLHAAKGHRYALAALNQLVNEGLNIHYTIVGDGPQEQEIQQEVSRLGLSQVVTMTGTRSETEVLDLLQSSHVLILPSVGAGEAAPVAVMEAMACGLPVICSIIGGTRDMIADGEDSFLVEQKDVQAIAERLRSLVRDPKLALDLGKSARSRALREFDCNLLAKKLLELINRNPT